MNTRWASQMQLIHGKSWQVQFQDQISTLPLHPDTHILPPRNILWSGKKVRRSSVSWAPALPPSTELQYPRASHLVSLLWLWLASFGEGTAIKFTINHNFKALLYFSEERWCRWGSVRRQQWKAVIEHLEVRDGLSMEEENFLPLPPSLLDSTN